ncbi:MAG: hypothetical protein ACRBCJ_07345 [Hyphomicrobiaceae bacterium]
MSQDEENWSVGRKVFVVLLGVVALGAVSLFTINAAGLSVGRCSDGVNYWYIFTPLCAGGTDPHEPSLAYVAALGVVLLVWVVKKVRG